MAKRAEPAERMTWRSSSSVVLSAQWRSSKTISIGVRRDTADSMAVTALEQAIALRLGTHAGELSRSRNAPAQLRDQGAELGASAAADSCARRSDPSHDRTYQVNDSTKGWYGTSASSSLHPMRTVVPSRAAGRRRTRATGGSCRCPARRRRSSSWGRPAFARCHTSFIVSQLALAADEFDCERVRQAAAAVQSVG